MKTAPIPRAQPLRAAVYARVADLVTSGQLAPGQAVTEASLSRLLGVSRTPVREALLRLEAAGVVQSALARGFTVCPLRPAEATELYPILATLEALAVRSSPFPRSDLPRLRTLADRLTRTTDPVRRWQVDTQLHEAIVSTSVNVALRDLVTQLRTRLSRYEIAFMRAVQDRRDVDLEHSAILDALAASDPERAAKLLEDNWRESMHAVTRWLETPFGQGADNGTAS
jgi:DNA-binding GntR family transcriptional regulator